MPCSRGTLGPGELVAGGREANSVRVVVCDNGGQGDGAPPEPSPARVPSVRVADPSSRQVRQARVVIRLGGIQDVFVDHVDIFDLDLQVHHQSAHHHVVADQDKHLDERTTGQLG